MPGAGIGLAMLSYPAHAAPASGGDTVQGLYGPVGQNDAATAKLRSVARMRAENPWLSNPQYWALQEKTLNVGLRRAGFPDQ